MQQNTKRLLSLIVALTFIVVALILFFEYIEPAYGDVQTLKGQLLADNQFLQTEKNTVSKAQSLISQYAAESAGTGTASLSAAMPSGPDVAGALAQIYGLAQANSISVQSIGISAPPIQQTPSVAGAPTAAQLVKPLGMLTLQVTAVGSYESFKVFLQSLETNVRLFDVKSISVQPAVVGSGKAGSQDFFTYSISITTYYQSQ